ncbi:unnamed protein product [Prorocentrum cordatum]|uniref:Uncharacterized protein n=1 Tax=Prorocentrum cordatum TaxID=2364126 RepID=A0ABN9RMR0_9DINO|nr:unnamed protein product [Polarella glacialis]
MVRRSVAWAAVDLPQGEEGPEGVVLYLLAAPGCPLLLPGGRLAGLALSVAGCQWCSWTRLRDLWRAAGAPALCLALLGLRGYYKLRSGWVVLPLPAMDRFRWLLAGAALLAMLACVHLLPLLRDAGCQDPLAAPGRPEELPGLPQGAAAAAAAPAPAAEAPAGEAEPPAPVAEEAKPAEAPAPAAEEAEECLRAVRALAEAAGGPSAPTLLEQGSGGTCLAPGWGQVPPNCSARVGLGWGAYYRSNWSGAVACGSLSYRLVCTGGPQRPASQAVAMHQRLREAFPAPEPRLLQTRVMNKNMKDVFALGLASDWMRASWSPLMKNRSPPRTVFLHNDQGIEKIIKIVERDVLPDITEPIVLFTLSHDKTIPRQLDKRYPNSSEQLLDRVRSVLDSPLIERWVVENLDTSGFHDKFMPIPLGFFCHPYYSCGPSWWPVIKAEWIRPLAERPLWMMVCNGRLHQELDKKMHRES